MPGRCLTAGGQINGRDGWRSRRPVVDHGRGSPPPGGPRPGRGGGTVMDDALARILAAAADGRFPPPDGSTTVVRQPSARDAGVLAFTAHSVVFTDEDPDWVRSVLAGTPGDALAATMNPYFLGALMAR